MAGENSQEHSGSNENSASASDNRNSSGSHGSNGVAPNYRTEQQPPSTPQPPPPQRLVLERQPGGQQRVRPTDDIITQYYIRGLIALAIAILIGYLYLHLETPPLSRHRLVPNEFSSFKKPTGAATRKPERESIPKSSVASSSDSSNEIEEDESPAVIRHDIHGKPFIDPKFEQHSKYLSHVLHTLGDISRKMEIGENITKPIGGIVEMRADVLDEEEEEDVPDYMKRLGSIIDDIQKSKTKGKYEKFKSTIKKSPFTDPVKVRERNEKRRKWKEELLAEQEQANREKPDPWNALDDFMNVVGENDDEVVTDELTADEKANLDDDFLEVAQNLNKFWEKYEQDEESDRDLFDFHDHDDMETVGKKSEESLEKLLERADKLKVGLEMIKVMLEIEEKEKTKRKASNREKKSSIEDEDSYTL